MLAHALQGRVSGPHAPRAVGERTSGDRLSGRPTCVDPRRTLVREPSTPPCCLREGAQAEGGKGWYDSAVEPTDPPTAQRATMNSPSSSPRTSARLVGAVHRIERNGDRAELTAELAGRHGKRSRRGDDPNNRAMFKPRSGLARRDR